MDVGCTCRYDSDSDRYQGKEMKKAVAAVGVLVLSGCAVGKDPALSRYDGLSFVKNSYGQEYITSARLHFPGEPPKTRDALPLCIAKNVDALPVGAEVVRFMAEDKRRAVAEGGTQFTQVTLMTPQTTTVRYTLDASIADDGRVYVFDKLDQRLEGSAGMGFIPIGAWSGSDGLEVVQELERLAAAINTCLSR